MIRCRIDQQIKIKLTEEGIAILKDFYEETREEILNIHNRDIGEFDCKEMLDRAGYYRDYFLRVMEIFGPHISNERNLFDKDFLLISDEDSDDILWEKRILSIISEVAKELEKEEIVCQN